MQIHFSRLPPFLDVLGMCDHTKTESWIAEKNYIFFLEIPVEKKLHHHILSPWSAFVSSRE